MRASEPAIARYDVWPTIETQDVIVADIDDEIALLAGAKGCTVRRRADHRPIPRRHLLISLQRSLAGFDYFDPWTGQPISLSAWIKILADWRRTIDRNREIGVVCGIAAWKRSSVSGFLWGGEPAVFAPRPPGRPARSGKAVAIWPSRVSHADHERVRARDGRAVQIEDGFIRSAGLGAKLVPPCSIVVDHSGIYYDPRTTNDLEQILAEADFCPELSQRAAKLAAFVTRHGITKYSEGGSVPNALPVARRKVLVAGQVADDRSVKLGCGEVAGTLDLLRRVREIEPDAFIVFKPHPDVVAGLRPGHVAEGEARRYVDLVLPTADSHSLLLEVDAVHVLTSLLGFEALLRGREVTTHGQPFYAGWGLTRDLAPPISRRNRKLTLDQLVAATLILYPRYRDPVTRLPCPPEILALRLSSGSMPRLGVLQMLRSMQGRLSISRLWPARTL